MYIHSPYLEMIIQLKSVANLNIWVLHIINELKFVEIQLGCTYIERVFFKYFVTFISQRKNHSDPAKTGSHYPILIFPLMNYWSGIFTNIINTINTINTVFEKRRFH